MLELMLNWRLGRTPEGWAKRVRPADLRLAVDNSDDAMALCSPTAVTGGAGSIQSFGSPARHQLVLGC